MIPLSEEAYVVAMDWPEIGSSETPPPSNDKRTLAKYVRDVLKQLGLQDVTLVGHDVGSQIVSANGPKTRLWRLRSLRTLLRWLQSAFARLHLSDNQKPEISGDVNESVALVRTPERNAFWGRSQDPRSCVPTRTRSIFPAGITVLDCPGSTAGIGVRGPSE